MLNIYIVKKKILYLEIEIVLLLLLMNEVWLILIENKDVGVNFSCSGLKVDMVDEWIFIFIEI